MECVAPGDFNVNKLLLGLTDNGLLKIELTMHIYLQYKC